MKDNGAQPAYPVMGVETEMEYSRATETSFPRTYSYEKDAGLTKREAFAMAAMQGILANRNYTLEDCGERGPAGTAKIAMLCADALLATLK